MIRRPTRRFTTLAATLCTFALLLAAAPAEAQAPDWPQNNHRYYCSYTLGGGASGNLVLEFTQLWANPHVFPDGNELKKGRLKQYIPSVHSPQTTLNDPIDLAWKPNELPSPPNGTRFELTFPTLGIQCKNFVKKTGPYNVPMYTFGQCSNGTTMSCTICGVGGYGGCP